ncbi:MAG: alpha/beta hydrolase [Bacilli bacterium]|nr:alpha/beta hydrolase [Bacilli bacterium]
MKKLGLLVMPLITTLLLASCGSKLSIVHQHISDAGVATIPFIKEIGLKEAFQEDKGWEAFWNDGLKRDKDFLKNDFGNWLTKVKTDDPEIGNKFKKTIDDISVKDNTFETWDVQLSDNYERVIFYIHGGAYFLNATSTYIYACYKLAKLFNAKVYLPIYPLAPQNNFYDCYEFLDKVYANINALNKDKEVIFCGDSAGGGLVLSYSQYLYKEKPNLKLPTARICFSPWCDATLTNPDIKEKEDLDITLAVFGLRKLGEYWSSMYASPYDYRISPIYGDLDDKISTIVFNGTDEIFLPDVEITCQKLHNNGARTKLVIGDGLYHIYPLYDLPEAEEAFQMAYDFVINNK